MYSDYLKQRVIGFVYKYGNDIIASIADTGLFFPAVVAQKILESGYGSSLLAAKYNNFGGIKNFGSLQGASGSVSMQGPYDSSPQPYAVFSTPAAGFRAYVDILHDPSKNYASYGVFNASSPEEQILLIAQAGYVEGIPPDEYLSQMQDMINATRDVYGFGKISTNVLQLGLANTLNIPTSLPTIPKA